MFGEKISSNAEGGTRTPTGCPTTPSRWRVYQVPPLRHNDVSDVYFGSCGVSGVSLCGAGASTLPLPSEVLDELGAICSPPNGVVTGAGVDFDAGVDKTTEPPKYCEENTASTSEVIIKMPAAAVVSLPRKLPGPRGPNTVWLAPPKALPIPAPLPACKRTIRTSAIATTTWMTTSGTYSQTGTHYLL
jgi:hypothetical protein